MNECIVILWYMQEYSCAKQRQVKTRDILNTSRVKPVEAYKPKSCIHARYSDYALHSSNTGHSSKTK